MVGGGGLARSRVVPKEEIFAKEIKPV